MGNVEKSSGKATSVTPTGREIVRELAKRNGAGLKLPKPNPGAMHQQGQDWSHGHACFPQTFVRLVGHRDPNVRPSSPLPQRPMITLKKPAPSDTPIG